MKLELTLASWKHSVNPMDAKPVMSVTMNESTAKAHMAEFIVNVLYWPRVSD